jgi:hypothetical protein
MAYNEKNAPRATINPDGSSFFFLPSQIMRRPGMNSKVGFSSFLGDVFSIVLVGVVLVFVRKMRGVSS